MWAEFQTYSWLEEFYKQNKYDKPTARCYNALVKCGGIA